MRKIFLFVFFMAFVSLNAYSQSDGGDNNIYALVDEPAKYPGGQAEMFKYLKDNLKYPEVAKANNVHGRVIVAFVIEKDGSTSEFKVKRGLSNECNEEAIRLIKSMPKWEPGKKKGKAVRTSMMVPVNF